jgi:hypothetical protein
MPNSQHKGTKSTMNETLSETHTEGAVCRNQDHEQDSTESGPDGRNPCETASTKAESQWSVEDVSTDHISRGVGQLAGPSESAGHDSPQPHQQAPGKGVHHITDPVLMVERIADLEWRVENLEYQKKTALAVPADVTPATIELPTSTTTAHDDKPELILGVRLMTFEAYKSTRAAVSRTDTHPTGPNYISHGPQDYLIDAVLGLTEIYDRARKDRTMQTDMPQDSPAISWEAPPNIESNDIQFFTPERIRINSPLLLKALVEITGQKFQTYSSWSTSYIGELRTQVMLRPFKLLVTYEPAIRAYTAELAKKHQASEANDHSLEARKISNTSEHITRTQTTRFTPISSAESAEQADTSINIKERDEDDDKQALLESKRCLQELQVLIGMFDTDLKPTFELRKRIEDGTLNTIAFADLWHLFRRGDNVFPRSDIGHSQVYRIAHVSGGRQYLCSREQAGLSPVSSSDQEGGKADMRERIEFTIAAVYYDTDGDNLIQDLRTFEIERYDGLKEVTLLPCYPLHFVKSTDSMTARENFIKRGKRFLELTRRSEVVHKRYEGLTLFVKELEVPNKEEIREEVIPQ